MFPLSFFCGAFRESQIPLFRPTCWLSLFSLDVALNPVLPWYTAINSVRDLHFSYSCKWLPYHLRTLQEYREYVHTFPTVCPVCLGKCLPVTEIWLNLGWFPVQRLSVHFHIILLILTIVLSASISYGLIFSALPASSTFLGLHCQKTFQCLRLLHNSPCCYTLSLLLPVLVSHFFSVGIHRNIL